MKINKNEIDSLEIILSNKETIKIDKSDIVDCDIEFSEIPNEGINKLCDGKLILIEKLGENCTFDEQGRSNRKLVKDRINGVGDVVYLKVKLNNGKMTKLNVPYEEKEDKTTGGVYGYKLCSEVRYTNNTMAILMGNSSKLKNVNF